MPKAWTDKDERMYKHVRDSEKKRGKSSDRAEEIAARTVNKQRRKDGKTSSSRTSGTGNPNTPLTDRSVTELRNRARELQIAGRSSMTKAQLVQAIRRRN
jgi:hypothetical protein